MLRHKTNFRSSAFLLKFHSTTATHLKVAKYGIIQTQSRRHGRAQENQIDETVLTEKWKIKGTHTATR